METNKIKESIGKTSNEDELIRKSFEYGKSIGKHEKEEKKRIKEEKKKRFKDKFNNFLKDISPVVFYIGLLIFVLGIWDIGNFMNELKVTGIIMMAIAPFMKFVEV